MVIMGINKLKVLTCVGQKVVTCLQGQNYIKKLTVR